MTNIFVAATSITKIGKFGHKNLDIKITHSGSFEKIPDIYMLCLVARSTVTKL